MTGSAEVVRDATTQETVHPTPCTPRQTSNDGPYEETAIEGEGHVPGVIATREI